MENLSSSTEIHSGKVTSFMRRLKLPVGFKDMLKFPFIDALTGRRSRRFFMGTEIPEGIFAYKSRHKILPLTELEKLLILSAVAGNTGWNYLIPYNDSYAPHLPNYASAPGGRTFPSSAGFHVNMTITSNHPPTSEPMRNTWQNGIQGWMNMSRYRINYGRLKQNIKLAV